MRQKKLVLAMVGLLSLASAGCQQLRARDNLNKGVRAFNETNYQAAVDYFTAALELDPELVEAELYLATAYSQQFIPGALGEDNRRMAELAIENFNASSSRRPRRDGENTTAMAGLANIYQNTNNLDRARDYYIMQAEIAPDDAVAQYSVGSLNWMIVFDKTVEREPEELSNLIEEGQQALDRALSLDEEYEDAMTYKNLLYREAAALIPEDSEDEAVLAEREDLLVQADEWFNKAMETRKLLAERAAANQVGQ